MAAALEHGDVGASGADVFLDGGGLGGGHHGVVAVDQEAVARGEGGGDVAGGDGVDLEAVLEGLVQAPVAVAGGEGGIGVGAPGVAHQRLDAGVHHERDVGGGGAHAAHGLQAGEDALELGADVVAPEDVADVDEVVDGVDAVAEPEVDEAFELVEAAGGAARFEAEGEVCAAHQHGERLPVADGGDAGVVEAGAVAAGDAEHGVEVGAGGHRDDRLVRLGLAQGGDALLHGAQAAPLLPAAEVGPAGVPAGAEVWVGARLLLR